MRLEQVYINLNTERLATPKGQQQRPDQQRQLSILEALNDPHPARLMLLGTPGSGKSTFVNHLALCLADAALAARHPAEQDQGDRLLARLTPHWQHGALLPIRIVLSDLAAFKPLTVARRGELAHFHDFLDTHLGGLNDARDQLRDALGTGHAILLFDGLDEVVDTTVLARVTECIEVVAGTYRQSPVLVTCRLLDYHHNSLRQLRGFSTERLAQLNDEQIAAFTDAWFAEYVASGRQTQASAGTFHQALADRPELREMASQPLLLTLMALVHAGKGRLPDTRALLYGECIELLLLHWRQEQDQPDLLDLLKLPRDRFNDRDLLKAIARLGFVAHTAGENMQDRSTPADLNRATIDDELRAIFRPYTRDPRRLDDLVSCTLHAIATRNGLLQQQSSEQGERYAFPHRSFQEFLAGYWISFQADYDALVLSRATQIHWHEAFRLMVGHQVLAQGQRGQPLSLARDLLQRGPVEQTLAGELLVLVGYERAASYLSDWAGTQGRWAKACATLHAITIAPPEQATASLRTRAALALGYLRYGALEGLTIVGGQATVMPDPRLLDPTTGNAPDGRYWCDMAPGTFWYGDDRRSKNMLQRMHLPYHFKIARFPVTNAEFAAFIAAGGYTNDAWWTPHGWRWRLSGGRPFSSEDNASPVNGPWLEHDRQFNAPTQPQVGVSWYEAVAYCHWITAQGHAQGWLPPEAEIRLPTSLEWEYAARGADSRQRYPWGDDQLTPEHANYAASGLGRPAPVGCFPKGRAAMSGAEDLVGNIGEWLATGRDTASEVKPMSDCPRDKWILLTWGDWSDGEERLYCVSRYWYNPYDRYFNLGFRVVWSRALIE
jgi:formylglycine-generating enzyme required for sulfatase activity/energy-coupling factor transporter ATP-binding protein EcfA2